MATVTKFGSVVNTVGTWASSSNIKADDGLYATTAGARNSNYDIIASGFGFGLPSNAVINSITINAQYKLSTTASASTLTLSSQYNGVARGTDWSSSAEPTVDTLITKTENGSWTPDELNSSLFEVLFRVKRTSNTACTYSIDYISVTIDYTVPDTTPPPNVTNLTVVRVDASTLLASWTIPTGSDQADNRVYLDGSLLSATTSTSMNISCDTSMTYDVMVTSRDSLLNESSGVTVTYTPPTDDIPPGDVTNASVSYNNSTSIRLTWTNPTDPDLLTISVYLDSVLYTSTSSSPLTVDCDPTQTHNITLKAVDSSGNSSAGVNLTYTDITPPANVTNLSAYVSGPTTIKVSWTNPVDSDFSTNEIYLDDVLKTTTSTSPFDITGINVSASHTIRVVSKDANGNSSSGQSVVVNDTTPPAEVTNPSSIRVSLTQIKVSWVKPSDIDYYYAIVYVDGVAKANTSALFANIDIDVYSSHTIVIKTRDYTGNVSSGVTITYTPDFTPPAEVTNASTSYSLGVAKVSWTKPADSDLAKVNVYVNGSLLGSVLPGTSQYYPLGSSQTDVRLIILKTVDTSGNESEGVTTKYPMDAVNPTAVNITDINQLSNSSIRAIWQASPSTDVYRYGVYLDDVFVAYTFNLQYDIPCDATLDHTVTIKAIDYCYNISETMTTYYYLSEVSNIVINPSTSEGMLDISWENPGQMMYYGTYVVIDQEEQDQQWRECFSSSVTVPFDPTVSHIIRFYSFDEGVTMSDGVIVDYTPSAVTAPTITQISVSAPKLSAQTGHNSVIVTFRVNKDILEWEARTESVGQGTGILVGNGGSASANTDITFDVTYDEITHTHGQVNISVYARNSAGWGV